MTGKFSQSARNALQSALEAARELGHTYIGSEHLLLGLLAEPDSAASRLLTSRGVTKEGVRARVVELSGKGERSYVSAKELTPRAKSLIENASNAAKERNRPMIGTEHLLLALLEDGDSVAAKILIGEGASPSELKGEALALAGGNFTSPYGEKRRSERRRHDNEGSALKLYGRDLSALAAEGKTDPVIGREKELERIMQILSRRTKNNPCLVGEPGVGKTAVVEGLAYRIAQRSVPEPLQGKTVITLDIPSMLAGAKYRGDFEERMKSVMEEARRRSEVILFVDEIHTIIGAGAAEGAIDAANILKPALARGELKLIGATTPSEYRRYIEKDAALERRFQAVTIGEPSSEEALSILHGLRPRYEAHHRLTVSDEALESAVRLSARYIHEKFLPDKAIDLVDEAASFVRMKAYTQPQALCALEEELEDVARRKEEAIRAQRFELAAGLRDRENELELSYEAGREAWLARSESLCPTVTADDIRETISRKTGIPLQRLSDREGERLRRLEEDLHRRVIGQEAAVAAVARSIRRARIGLKDPHRPVGSFIFLGPTGVGKTELSKALAELLYGSEDNMVRLDMSEYMEKHAVSKLIGSPPGYVGYEDAGQLTEKIRQKPYAVVLFDEIEKAHPDVFNLLLQLLEDGRLSDSQGRVADFSNTVVILTSNAGAEIANNARRLGFSPVGDEKASEGEVRKKLREVFRPEFLNRIDEILVFQKLSDADVARITRLLLASLAKRLSSLGVTATFDESVVTWITDEADTAHYGARPLRRTMERRVEDAISEYVLDGALKEGDCVRFAVRENGLSFVKETRETASLAAPLKENTTNS